jgi:hypothetical protein
VVAVSRDQCVAHNTHAVAGAVTSTRALSLGGTGTYSEPFAIVCA